MSRNLWGHASQERPGARVTAAGREKSRQHLTQSHGSKCREVAAAPNIKVTAAPYVEVTAAKGRSHGSTSHGSRSRNST